MERYIINYGVYGYTPVDAKTALEKVTKDDKLYAVVNEDIEGKLHELYTAFKVLLKAGVRIYLIGVEGTSELFKPLASLLILYDRYDIYEVANKEDITPNYLTRIETREPDACEAMHMIDNSIMAYSDISTLLIGIESLVSEGNMGGLSSFIESHLQSIENLSVALDYMSKLADMNNSSELLQTVDKLRAGYNELNTQLEEAEEKAKEVKADKEKLAAKLRDTERELIKIKDSNTELQELVGDSGGIGVVKGYTECNTALIRCKTKIVLYFKEVSYVAYVNSLMLGLLEWLKMKEITYKMVIYDNQTELLGVYKPLNVVDGREYVNNKHNLFTRADKFVTVEPAQAILNDILTASPSFDVVVVYDRMRGLKDIVTGNNVAKFYVINSKREYDEVKSSLKITDDTHIITRTDSTFAPNTLDIPFIDGYKTASDAAKTSKYFKLATAKTKTNLIKFITEQSRITSIK